MYGKTRTNYETEKAEQKHLHFWWLLVQCKLQMCFPSGTCTRISVCELEHLDTAEPIN